MKFDYDIIKIIYLFIISTIFVIIIVIDFKHSIIPDSLNFSILFITLLFQIIYHPQGTILDSLRYGSLGSFIGGAIFFSLSAIGKKIYHQEVLGGGDIKFVVAIGLLLGWQGILIAIFISAVFGLLFGIISAICQKKSLAKLTIPYGPFLVLGSISVIFWGHYLELLIFEDLILN